MLNLQKIIKKNLHKIQQINFHGILFFLKNWRPEIITKYKS